VGGGGGSVQSYAVPMCKFKYTSTVHPAYKKWGDMNFSIQFYFPNREEDWQGEINSLLHVFINEFSVCEFVITGVCCMFIIYSAKFLRNCFPSNDCSVT
jgi:hypothetical protein